MSEKHDKVDIKIKIFTFYLVSCAFENNKIDQNEWKYNQRPFGTSLTLVRIYKSIISLKMGR